MEATFNIVRAVFERLKEGAELEQCIVDLKNAFNENDHDQFCTAFIDCMHIPLFCEQKKNTVENALKFGASFAVLVEPQAEDGDRESPFLKRVFDYVLEKQNAKLTPIRYRICYFLKLIFDVIHIYHVNLSDDLLTDIKDAMLVRIKDKSEKVRRQAVYVLKSFQIIHDYENEVIEVFIYHLTNDISCQVRKAIIQNIIYNRETFQSVLRRIQDVDDSVRKAAYLFLANVQPQTLEQEERQEILKNGLNDENKKVSEVVKTSLLSAWLSKYDCKIDQFLDELDTEKETDVCIDISNILLALLLADDEPLVTKVNDFSRKLKITEDKSLIPINELTHAKALLWHCFLKYLQKQESNHLFERIKPNLDDLCGYIKQCAESILDNELTDNTKKTLQATLCQLLEITKLYDLSDGVEKNLLKQLLKDTLKMKLPELQVTELVVEIYEKILPNITLRVEELKSIITEIGPFYDNYLQFGEEEENDSYKILKCLDIMCSMLKSVKIKNVTPTIRNLFESVALPCILHNDKHVQVQALNAVGLCSLLDGELAKEHIIEFFIAFNNEDNNFNEKRIMSLSIIFNLILEHGFDYFNWVPILTCLGIEPTDEPAITQILDKLHTFFHDKEPAIQLGAVEGFIKLLIQGSMNSPLIVSDLIVLLYNRDYRNSKLQQSVKSFFEYYPLLRIENQHILGESFFPVLLRINTLTETNPLFQIEPFVVGYFILDLTRYTIYETETGDSSLYTVHNNISHQILRELASNDTRHDKKSLINCLNYVDINISDEASQNEMLEMCDNIENLLPYSNKTKMVLKKFRDSIKSIEETDDNTNEESEDAEESVNYNIETDSEIE